MEVHSVSSAFMGPRWFWNFPPWEHENHSILTVSSGRGIDLESRCPPAIISQPHKWSSRPWLKAKQRKGNFLPTLFCLVPDNLSSFFPKFVLIHSDEGSLKSTVCMCFSSSELSCFWIWGGKIRICLCMWMWVYPGFSHEYKHLHLWESLPMCERGFT